MREKHPWQTFLEARMDVIVWMRDEKNRSDQEIAEALSMNVHQVASIRFYVEIRNSEPLMGKIPKQEIT